MTPQRIQRQRTRGWRMPDGAIYVGRPSKWGNPFRIGEAVRLGEPLWAYIAETVPGGPRGLVSLKPTNAAQVVSLHEAWIIQQPHLMLTTDELADHDLACWCPPHQPCHADVLLRIANQEDPS
jgi:hypothetical protein